MFTPEDGHNWLIAKTIVDCSDGNYHEAVSHLGRTHLLIEPIAISAFRQFAPIHPLFRLLTPHFEGTFRVNSMAWKHLISDGGAVERLFGGPIQKTRQLAVDGLRSFNVRRATLPMSLADRGVDDSTWLASYPYRDDALLYWNVIAKWVLDYLRYLLPLRRGSRA